MPFRRGIDVCADRFEPDEFIPDPSTAMLHIVFRDLSAHESLPCRNRFTLPQSPSTVSASNASLLPQGSYDKSVG